MKHTIDIHTKNTIHPTAVIDDCVVMGTGNYVGPFCYLTGSLEIGNNNRFEAYCSIGTRPEHKDYWQKDGYVEIGDNNVFREYITIHAGTKDLTRIENNVIMLRGSHVAHDCVIENRGTLSVNAVMLGHVFVMHDSNCGSGCQVHQHQVVGAWSMIGMGCVLPKKTRISPGQVWVGNPGKNIKVNDYIMKDVSETQLNSVTERFLNLRDKHGL